MGINTSENFYTFFMMDCLNNSTLVVCDKNSFFEKRNLNKNILLSNYSKTNITCNKIYNFLSKSKFNNVWNKPIKFPKNLYNLKFTKFSVIFKIEPK